ncbi:Pre-rRNA-processing protein TSR1 homolog [Durusdinium trenchii]|uniref:Pre-rRNA-processing protein TSR1 homolog n=1 Tax=Durusdinium trenchii TaxID=1381693 RepID=A0ABP0I4T8_9DINO
MHAGFRRFSSRPIFSEIPRKTSTNKKYKFIRFLHQEVTACASFYAPVVFPPCRLLMSVQPEGAVNPELAAAGSIVSVDPKQLIIKRIILTGYPFRTQKNKAVVRFMFFSPQDIRWFKPVELSTKKGLRGHIKESLGTHGYMKCRFSAHIKQDDTVCMNLYKRVYPKWHPPAWGGNPGASPEEA